MSSRASPWRSLSGIDAYARAEKHLVQHTSVGAIITIIGAILAAVLFCNELHVLIQPQRLERMGVDVARGSTLRINIDMSLTALPCHAVILDLAEMSKGIRNVAANERDTQLARGGQIHKYRLDRFGRQIAAHEYIRPQLSGGFFLESLSDVTDVEGFADAMRDKEGCQLTGFLDVQRVSGNLHISVAMQDFFMLPDTQAEMVAALKKAQASAVDAHQPVFWDVTPDTTRINVSHTIHHLSFGEEFPGQVHPLDGYVQTSQRGSGTYKYFLKVVPTEYRNPRGRQFHTNQFSVTEYYSAISKGKNRMPAIFFIYDLSPISVAVTDSRRSFLHFLVRLCAVVGGVFAVTGIVDRFVHRFVVSKLHPPPVRLRTLSAAATGSAQQGYPPAPPLARPRAPAAPTHFAASSSSTFAADRTSSYRAATPAQGSATCG